MVSKTIMIIGKLHGISREFRVVIEALKENNRYTAIYLHGDSRQASFIKDIEKSDKRLKDLEQTEINLLIQDLELMDDSKRYFNKLLCDLSGIDNSNLEFKEESALNRCIDDCQTMVNKLTKKETKIEFNKGREIRDSPVIVDTQKSIPVNKLNNWFELADELINCKVSYDKDALKMANEKIKNMIDIANKLAEETAFYTEFKNEKQEILIQSDSAQAKEL